ncbi:hypothetical protein HQ590_01505 [bacterium]|nr:hypothetical protein [bacterium]
MSAPIQTVVAGSGASAPAVWIGPALVLALLMMGVVIGLFWYLRRRVKQQYFTLWTAAWIGYALYRRAPWGSWSFPTNPCWTVWGSAASA